MSEDLEPDLARALQEPARLVRADPALLDVVRGAGPAAQSRLRELSSGTGTPEDRYAAAAMLAALFGDHGPLDQAARGYGSTPPRELVALTEVPALRPALRRSLSSPVLTGLLEWGTTPDAAHPPLELAMAARDLELTDSSVLLSVARRADQVAEQGAKRSQQGPLARFSEVLRAAAEAGGGAAAASSSPVTEADPGPRPTPREPETAGPQVTTSGIPASEMLSEDEQREPAPDAGGYPGTGVPVRDSIAGPRQDSPDGAQAPDPYLPDFPADDDAVPRDRAPGSGERAEPFVPPRQPSTNELYYGVGSDRWADRDPDSEETRADDRHVARNWAITFGVIVAVIVVLVLLF